jgi:hypothetical protein
MITFLPFPDFGLSACCLDDERLGKQRQEALAIYTMLKEHKKGWNIEPACKMWNGFTNALAWYHNVMVSTWKHRGKPNTMDYLQIGFPVVFPPWLGDSSFHRSHQSNLLNRNESHYRIWFPASVPKNMKYVWPIGERRVLPR